MMLVRKLHIITLIKLIKKIRKSPLFCLVTKSGIAPQEYCCTEVQGGMMFLRIKKITVTSVLDAGQNSLAIFVLAERGSYSSHGVRAYFDLYLYQSF